MGSTREVASGEAGRVYSPDDTQGTGRQAPVSKFCPSHQAFLKRHTLQFSLDLLDSPV